MEITIHGLPVTFMGSGDYGKDMHETGDVIIDDEDDNDENEIFRIWVNQESKKEGEDSNSAYIEFERHDVIYLKAIIDAWLLLHPEPAIS